MGGGAIVKAVSEYGVLGLGWLAWLLTMWYLQVERRRYQALVIHIVQYFTKVNLADRSDSNGPDEMDEDPFGGQHGKSLGRLFGRAYSQSGGEEISNPTRTGRSTRSRRG
jgi:hypothetical protein